MNHVCLRSSREHPLQTAESTPSGLQRKFASKLRSFLTHLWAHGLLFQDSAFQKVSRGAAWAHSSGPSKGPWFFPPHPSPSAIVSRTAFAVSQASGLIKTPKGSNPWMLLKDLQLLPFMKKAGWGGGCSGAGRAGERRIWTRASYPNRAPIKTDRVVFYQLKLSCLLSRSISPFNSH